VLKSADYHINLEYNQNKEIEDDVRQWIREGTMPSDTRRKWSSSLDKNTCPTCRALDGVTVGMDENFPGGITLPPVHIDCRCVVEYVFD